ncbi:PFP-BETA2 [Symbiodinium natans]|uniref:PFP-BETA2 protein n=1 Tax=Symbiodinium natans TaxID=878477 RepID=A0A812V4L4_9DINO|nr:PFP-BETA2 [Symbiodinium natans]
MATPSVQVRHIEADTIDWQPCAIPLARLLKLGAHDKQRVPDEFELSSFNPRPSLDGAHLEPIAKRRQLTKQAESGRFIGLFQLACVGQPRKMELSSFLRWCNRPVPSCSSELSLHFSRLEFPALLNQDVCAMDSYRFELKYTKLTKLFHVVLIRVTKREKLNVNLKVREKWRYAHSYRQPGPLQLLPEHSLLNVSCLAVLAWEIEQELMQESDLSGCGDLPAPEYEIESGTMRLVRRLYLQQSDARSDFTTASQDGRRHMIMLSPLQKSRLGYQPNLPQATVTKRCILYTVLQSPRALSLTQVLQGWKPGVHCTCSFLMGNAPPISAQQLKQLRSKYDKDGNGDLSWEEFQALALEVGELQGLKQPVSDEKLLKIFKGLDKDSSGSVNFQEFEAAHAALQAQLQAAAKAKAKAKPKAKGKAKPKPKAKATAEAVQAEEPKTEVQDGQASIFDSLPGFGSFVPDLGVSALFAEDTRVPVAKAIPTPKKTKPPPLPEAAPPPLSSQVPWSMQLKSADPDWYDPDDAEYSGSDDFPDIGEMPTASAGTAPAPPKADAEAKAEAKPVPKPKVGPKAKADAKAKAKQKAKAKPGAKPKAVVPGAPAAKGRAEGVSAVQGVTEDVFSSPIHRREAVAHPADKRDPRTIRALQTPGGLDLIEQAPEVLSEPESQDSVDSISGEVARSWDPTAKDVRYTYARDRAVGFSEFWRPLKWSREEWERRLTASGNLRKRGVGVMKHGKAEADRPVEAKVAKVDAEPDTEPEDLIAPEKPKPRSQYPLATEVKPRYIDKPLVGLKDAAAEGAVNSLRKTSKKPALPSFGSFDDELLNSSPAPRDPVRPGEPLVPLATAIQMPHLAASQESHRSIPQVPQANAPNFGYPGTAQPVGGSWQPPTPVYSSGLSPRGGGRPLMQEVHAAGAEQPAPAPAHLLGADYGDKPGRTWL